jgi:hypothetical protein
MARSRRRAPQKRRPSTALTRKQQSRLERERRLERAVIVAAVTVGVVVVGVLVYGLIGEYVIKARSPVATVGESVIRTDEFQARVRFLRANMVLQLEQWRQQRTEIDPASDAADFMLSYIDQNISQLEATLAEENKAIIGRQAVDQLVRFEIARQEGARVGLAVSLDDVQQKIEQDFQYDRAQELPAIDASPAMTDTNDAQPAPTPVTEEVFRERYDYFLNEILKPLGISEDVYRSWTRAELLEQRLRESFAGDVPEEADQISYRLIVASDAERAQELATRLDAGESFQDLVDEIEADEEASDYVRESGWLPREQVEETLDPAIAGTLWAMENDATAGPLSSEDGFGHYLAELQGHEVRPLDAQLRASLVDELFEEWLGEQRSQLVEIEDYLDRIPSKP